MGDASTRTRRPELDSAVSSYARKGLWTASAGLKSSIVHETATPDPIRSRNVRADVDVEASRVRRRNRQIFQCLECRRRKLKCDKRAPCANCLQSARSCRYLEPAKDARSQRRLAEVKDCMSALEDDLGQSSSTVRTVFHKERDVNGPSMSGAVEARNLPANEEAGEELLRSTPLAALDNVYDDNLDDEHIDLGVQVGKLRLTERVGGWVRFKLVEELNSTLQAASESKGTMTTTSKRSNSSTRPFHRAHVQSFIGSGPDYIPPSANLFFPTFDTRRPTQDHLPTKHLAELLKARYAVAVHPIARAVHWPTFEAQWDRLWMDVSDGIDTVPEVQAIIFAALFSAAVSMSDAAIMGDFDTNKAALVSQLQAGTEAALVRANFFLTTRLSTIQAFVMYLIPLVRSEVSRAHSALVGMAIRLAKCIGLHRDGSHYAMTKVEVQVRRLIWHQLCFLDLRTCEATGPSLDIRPDETDVRFPLNVNDQDLDNTSLATELDESHWTDMTLSRIRAELTDIRRKLWSDVVQIQRNQISLTTTLIKIQKLSQTMQSSYGAMLDGPLPIQRVARCVMEIGISGWFIQVLHRYITNTAQPMPDRLRQMLISNGLKQIQNAVALETRSELSPWSWYRGALHQYHVAILLIREVHTHPGCKDAATIWKYLDYIFDLPPSMAAHDKGELIITDLRDQMATYYAMRKVRMSTRTEERASSLSSSGVSSPVNHHQTSPSQPGNLSSTFTHGAALKASSAYDISADRGPLARENPAIRPLWPLPELVQSAAVNSERHDAVASGTETWPTLDDIDWTELDKYFPVEQYPTDLFSAEWLPN